MKLLKRLRGSTSNLSEDFIDSTFADLNDFYPGSKRKRKKIEPKKPEVIPDRHWDSKSIKKTLPNGSSVEMFTIGALAQALGRPVITLRLWIKEGYLPASPYRLPSKKDINGEDHLGRRLYSRAMVEKVVELFTEAGVLEVKRIEWQFHKSLSENIAKAWSKIRDEETK